MFAEGPVKTPRAGKWVGDIVVTERMEIKETLSTFKRIVRVTEWTIDKEGQFLLVPDITLEGWWTALDLERLPSGMFATNDLVMTLGAFAHNILCFIGQTGLIAPFGPVRHSAKR